MIPPNSSDIGDVSLLRCFISGLRSSRTLRSVEWQSPTFRHHYHCKLLKVSLVSVTTDDVSHKWRSTWLQLPPCLLLYSLLTPPLLLQCEMAADANQIATD